MKAPKLIALGLTALFLAACSETHYVPVYVPVEKKVSPPRKVVTKPKPTRPVESAEGFRAVEKPGTYSN